MLRYATGGSNATVDAPLPAATLNPLLVLASYYGYSEVVSSLLRQGADPNAVNVHVRRAMIAGVWVAFFQECQQSSCGQGVRSVQAACMGIGRSNDKTADLSARVERAKAVLALLVEAKAALAPAQGSAEGEHERVCEEMAEEHGFGQFAEYLAQLRQQADRSEL